MREAQSTEPNCIGTSLKWHFQVAALLIVLLIEGTINQKE